MKRLIRLILGVAFILLGLLGLVLPVLQGILFLALGALLLAEDIPFLHRLVRWLEERAPPIKKTTDHVRNFLKGSRSEDEQS